MPVVEIGPWKVHCDVEATRRAYLQIAGDEKWPCECDYCRNFRAAAPAQIYTPKVKRLLESLGITPGCEAETMLVSDVEQQGGYAYQGWYHFVGRIDPATVAGRFETRLFTHRPLDANFAVCLHEDRCVAHDAFAAKPLVQLEFAATLPWVIDAPKPKP